MILAAKMMFASESCFEESLGLEEADLSRQLDRDPLGLNLEL